jgi:hypothetical protein
MHEYKGVAIFDLDGCVFDDGWRRDRLPKKGTKDQNAYSHYHSGLMDDDVIGLSRDLIFWYADNGYQIIFSTSRPTSVGQMSCEKIKEVFNRKHKAEIHFQIMTRPDGDSIATVDLKRKYALQILEGAAIQGVPVAAAYDDRQDIVAMYGELGIAASVLDLNGLQPKLTVELPHGVVCAVADGPVQMMSPDVAAVPSLRRPERDAGDIMLEMGATFKERNAIYKDNAELVGQIMALMFPNGVSLTTPADFHMWHLFELKIVKLTRFVKSGLTHEDSIHDDAIYSAMCERLVGSHSIKVN